MIACAKLHHNHSRVALVIDYQGIVPTEKYGILYSTHIPQFKEIPGCIIRVRHAVGCRLLAHRMVSFEKLKQDLPTGKISPPDCSSTS